MQHFDHGGTCMCAHTRAHTFWHACLHEHRVRTGSTNANLGINTRWSLLSSSFFLSSYFFLKFLVSFWFLSCCLLLCLTQANERRLAVLRCGFGAGRHGWDVAPAGQYTRIER